MIVRQATLRPSSNCTHQWAALISFEQAPAHGPRALFFKEVYSNAIVRSDHPSQCACLIAGQSR